jgi:hypothetical protein
MRLLTILAILSLSGCGVESKRGSYVAAWVKPVEQKLSLLEHHYREWQRSKRTEGIPSREHYWGVKFRIWDLWILTGHCLFADIPCNELVENSPKISKRYRNFVGKHSKTPIQEILFKGLEANTEVIRTEYCLPALLMIQRRVDFENAVHVTDHEKCLEIPSGNCAKAYQAMREWFEENKNRLSWNPFFGVFFRDSPWRLRSFILPDEVIEAIENIFGVSDLSLDSSRGLHSE